MKQIDEKAKKILVIFGAIIGIIILIFIIAFIFGKAKNSSLSYEKIEEKLVEAAKKYYESNQEELPITSEETVEVSSDTLVNKGLLKELSSYQKENSVACSGSVRVTKSGEYYNYFPYLDCGEAYRTIYLYEKLLDYVVTEGDGLYKTSQYSKSRGTANRFIYRGEYPNNYILIDDIKWRIVKINEDNTITLIQSKLDSNKFEPVTWDDRFNVATDEYSGISNFDESRIKRTLEKYYQDLFTASTKAKLIKTKSCVGTRLNKDNKNNGSLECSKISSEETFATLLPVYDFLNASLDINCKATVDKSCGNYNYLAKYSYDWWTLTTNTNYNTTAYVIETYANRKALNKQAYARMVITLNDNVIYASGTGTSEDPYIIR